MSTHYFLKNLITPKLNIEKCYLEDNDIFY